ncbi:MAG: hypothetical protein NCW75_07990 [Phycisphaera sp.]|nr:MAG: hypothetical protein NCW75_07990 [Phycisphaera sp.]
MSPIDPRELGQSPTPQGSFEDGSRCVKCNYDLTGLPQATVCPECGTSNARITYEKKRGTGVSRAPIAYVNHLSKTLWLAALGFFGYIFFTVVLAIAENYVTLGLEFLAICGWVGALWLVTKPKPDRFEAKQLDTFDDPRWRWASVGTQACHIVAAIIYALLLVPKLSVVEGLLIAGVYIFDTIAVLGFIPVCVQLASLAGWMGDEDAERRLQTVAWLLAVGGLGLLLTPVMAMVLPIFGVLIIVFVICMLIGVVMLCLSLISLAKEANWAVQNTKHKSVVSGRRAVIERDRATAAEEKLEERLDALDNPNPSTRAGRRGIPKDIPVPRSHNIERHDGTDPYDIDED